MISLSKDQVLWLRMRAQRLVPNATGASLTIAQLVQELGGIQAQEPLAARLAVRPRVEKLTLEDVERAQAEERSVVRTWGPRGTLHILATEDLGWLLPTIGPVFIAGMRRRRMELGLDEEVCARGIKALREGLAGQGPLMKAEIGEQLERRGIHTEGQATIHLICRAALEGVLCLGPERGAKSTYVLLSDWVNLGPALAPEKAYEQLALRYLSAYGPATPEDMATWSGLPMNQIRAAWSALNEQLLEIRIENEAAWMLKTHETRLDEPPLHTSITRLLPAFDIYLLGYRNRELLVPPQYTKRINAGGGMLKPVLLVNGRVAGIWSTRKKKCLEITVEPFEQLAPQARTELAAEVADFARFLGTQTTVSLQAG